MTDKEKADKLAELAIWAHCNLRLGRGGLVRRDNEILHWQRWFERVLVETGFATINKPKEGENK